MVSTTLLVAVTLGTAAALGTYRYANRRSLREPGRFVAVAGSTFSIAPSAVSEVGFGLYRQVTAGPFPTAMQTAIDPVTYYGVVVVAACALGGTAMLGYSRVESPA